MMSYTALQEVSPKSGYFSVAPACDDTVTVGIQDKSHRWVYVRRGLALDPLTYYAAERLYAFLCDLGWNLCWQGTRWF